MADEVDVASPPAVVQARVRRLIDLLDGVIPAKQLDWNLLVATWNLRAFGGLTKKWASVGDFNIDRAGDPLYDAFTSTGLAAPPELNEAARTIFDQDAGGSGACTSHAAPTSSTTCRPQQPRDRPARRLLARDREEERSRPR
jgi:hypothetical protein